MAFPHTYYFIYVNNSAVAHPGDPGTQEVFQILRQIPDREIRVIGAITKCDRKQEGAENWVGHDKSRELVTHSLPPGLRHN